MTACIKALFGINSVPLSSTEISVGNYESMGNLSVIPRDVTLLIFSYLDIYDIAKKCARINRYCYHLFLTLPNFDKSSRLKIANAIFQLRMEKIQEDSRMLAVLSKHCAAATEVEFENIRITGEAIDIVSTNLMRIDRFSLSSVSCTGFKQIPSGVLKKLTRSHPEITHLDVSFCPNLTSAEIKEMIYNCHQLTDLSLGNCISKSLIRKIVKKHPQLKRLSLGRVEKIDDKTLTAICANCPNLVYLNIDGCTRVTVKGVEAIKKLSQLRSFTLHDCQETESLRLYMRRENRAFSALEDYHFHRLT